MGFDFDHAQRQKLGYQLIDRINQYFSSLKNLPVQLPADQRTFGDLTGAMPELGSDAASILDGALTELIAKGFHVPSANYFGLMNPTPAYMAVLAEMLVAALNPQLASLARSQLASKIERETVRWMAARIGPGWNEQTSGGTFTTGGNEANFSALAIALHQHFPTARRDGLASLPSRPVFYSSAESHHTLDKSAILLGLGSSALRRVAADSAARLDLPDLAAQVAADRAAGLAPFAVVATAGTTNSGAIDPLPEIAAFCREQHLWMHVDAAYGGALVMSDHHRHLLKGLDLADSITIDPHKWLAMPFAAGLLLTRHQPLLEQTFAVSTSYMPQRSAAELAHEPEETRPVDYYRVSTQWSRRMNSLKLWLTLRVHGRQAYEQLINRQFELADFMEYSMLATGLYEKAVDRSLPILNLRLRHISEGDLATAHAAIVDEVTRDGAQWISHTTVNGRSVLRMMIISYLTGEQHVRQLAASMERAAKLVLEKHSVRA